MEKVTIIAQRDIFSDEKDPIMNYKIYELDKIWDYDKRVSSPQYEFFYVIYSFSIKSSLVDESIDMFEQLEYLKSKPKEIQEKFQFKKSEILCGKSYKYEGIANTLKMDYENNKEKCDSVFWRNLYNPYN